MSLRMWMTVAILVGAGLLLGDGSVRGQEQKAATPSTPSARQSEAAGHLSRAVLLYRQKNYDQAAAEVEEAMKLQPTSEEIVHLRDQIGQATLVEMLNHPKLRAQVRSILQLAEQEVMRKQTDPATIQKHIEDLSSEDFTVYWKAITELVASGDIAVPYLLQTLCDPKPTHASTLAVVALNKMQWRATLPLIEALKSDNINLRQNVCGVLGGIGDGRACAALKAVCEDPDESSVVRGKAAEALAKITGKPVKELPSAGNLYRDLAEKYYAGDYSVLHAMVEPTMLVWCWEEPAPEPAGSTAPPPKPVPVSEKLRAYAVPRFMFNRIMAQNACFDGLAVDPSNQKLIETLVATYYNALGELSAALRGYRTSTLGFKFSDEEIKTLQATYMAAQSWSKLAEITGSKYINLALERALAEGNGPMAGECVRGLRNVGDNTPHAGVSGLIAAMSNPDKFLRYAAAEALVTIAPRGNLGGEALAMRVLSAALSENARRTIILAQRNTQQTNALKAALRVGGDFNLIEVADVNAASSYIRKSFQPVDIVIVEHGIAGADTASFARRLKKGATTPNIGIIVTTSKDPDQIARAYGDCVDAILNDATAAKELMEKVQAILARPGVKMDEKAVVYTTKLRAAQALASLDPESTAYPMESVASALALLLDEEDETLRSLALTCLGKIGVPTANAKILQIIGDKNQPEKLRNAALLAIGGVFERTRKVQPEEYEVVKAALKEPKLRANAAIALGKAALGPKTLSEVLGEIRPPVRTQAIGGGEAAGTTAQAKPAVQEKK